MTKGSNSSGPPTGRRSYLRPAGNRNGPSPLGPSASRSPPASLQGNEIYQFPFEKCPHRMEYMNGPCGAGPYNHSNNPASWMKPTLVAFEGSYLPFDTDLQRDKEVEHLEAYQKHTRQNSTRSRTEPHAYRPEMKTKRSGPSVE